MPSPLNMDGFLTSVSTELILCDQKVGHRGHEVSTLGNFMGHCSWSIELPGKKYDYPDSIMLERP